MLMTPSSFDLKCGKGVKATKFFKEFKSDRGWGELFPKVYFQRLSRTRYFTKALGLLKCSIPSF